MTMNESRLQYPAPVAIEHPELLAYRSEFPILQRKTYLNSCSLGALSNRSMQGLAQFMETWNEWGAHAWYEIWMGEIAKARQKFATIIGAQLHEVAILFEREVDDKTVLVATSRVFYTSGYIQDVRSVADIAHKHGAYMLVDDYQGTGQIPINVNAVDVDFLVTGTLKWLMGGPGLAFVYIREGLISQLQPIIAGWFGHREQFQFKTREFDFRPEATRVEMGTPAVAAIYAANGGLDIVQEISVEQICERTRYLTNDLIAQAREHGWKVRAPLEPEQRSSIVMLEIEHPEEVVKALVARNIISDSRPGLLRVSPYFYNSIEENALVIDAIAEIIESRK
ncbi:MAG: aminotransferase class V-fold PLP-dependent enzyme [Chloroflexi bacterium]|nr:MAG: aminotransferase class V-fold PLP-dependent enzyme [Chloroflexota bacterium]